MLDFGYYTLKHRKVIHVTELLVWGKKFHYLNRRVRQTYLGNTRVSTVFLGLDHGYGGPPLFFETMIFGDKRYEDMREYQDRCTTHRQALAMHWKAVAYAKRVSQIKLI